MSAQQALVSFGITLRVALGRNSVDRGHGFIGVDREFKIERAVAGRRYGASEWAKGTERIFRAAGTAISDVQVAN